MTRSPQNVLPPNRRTKDGKSHSYWSLVETVRTPEGPRQRTLCSLRRITEPTAEQKSLLKQLGISLPERFELNRKCSVDSAIA